MTLRVNSGEREGDRPLLGIAYAIGAVAALSLMDGLAKWVVATTPVLLVISIRSAICLLIYAPFVPAAGGLAALRTRRPWLHAARAASVVVAITAFFESLNLLELATVIAIGFGAPLILTALSVILLREKVDGHRWAAVILGFIGVLVILRPGGGMALDLGAVLALVATLFFALSQIAVRALTRTESDAAIIVYTNLGVLLGSGVAAPLVWRPLGWIEIAGIAAMAALVTVGQVLAVRGLRYAPVAVTAPFQYAELIFAALLGYLVWNEVPGPHVWVGAAIVAAAGLYVVWRETRARPARPL